MLGRAVDGSSSGVKADGSTVRRTDGLVNRVWILLKQSRTNDQERTANLFLMHFDESSTYGSTNEPTDEYAMLETEFEAMEILFNPPSLYFPGQTTDRLTECMIDKRINCRTDGRTDGWTDSQTAERTDCRSYRRAGCRTDERTE